MPKTGPQQGAAMQFKGVPLHANLCSLAMQVELRTEALWVLDDGFSR